MKVILNIVFLYVLIGNVHGRDYNISHFGAKNDSVTLNTNIIQGAIDFITENGGGRLIFEPGVYLTGTIFLKSNVTLHLEKGAEIRGSGNPFDFMDKYLEWTGLLLAVKQDNIGVSGEGTLNAMGYDNANNLVTLIHKGIVRDGLKYDRPDGYRTTVICFGESSNIRITGVTLKDPSGWTLVQNQCKNVQIDRIKIDGTAFWNNDGIDIVDCDGVVIKDSYIDASDDGICFKSHDASKVCQNVIVENCTVRSSASGLKFGTLNRGGFRNFKISNLKVFDTHRSAITIQAVDGGIVENILIDGVKADNVGNAIFLRIGDRWSMGKTPAFSNVTIKNVSAVIASSKADSGYRYEGPVEDLPRNISPSGIIGLPEWKIKHVLLSNIEIIYPGGGNPDYARQGTTKQDLENIPEMAYAYPEFSQFKELPAWGLYIRHAEDITLENVILKAGNNDYRPALVADDVKEIKLTDINISEPDSNKKKQIIFNNTSTRKP